MSIERLRALSADLWNEAQGASDTYADALMHASGKLDTLIAELGREVGAVAEVCTVVGPGEKGVRIRWMGGFPKIGTKLYTSPAHTSEARDAERLDWLTNNRASIQPELDGPWFVEVYGDGEDGVAFTAHQAKTPREAIDAAMRQEAGDE